MDSKFKIKYTYGSCFDTKKIHRRISEAKQREIDLVKGRINVSVRYKFVNERIICTVGTGEPSQMSTAYIVCAPAALLRTARHSFMLAPSALA